MDKFGCGACLLLSRSNSALLLRYYPETRFFSPTLYPPSSSAQNSPAPENPTLRQKNYERNADYSLALAPVGCSVALLCTAPGALVLRQPQTLFFSLAAASSQEQRTRSCLRTLSTGNDRAMRMQMMIHAV